MVMLVQEFILQLTLVLMNIYYSIAWQIYQALADLDCLSDWIRPKDFVAEIYFANRKLPPK